MKFGSTLFLRVAVAVLALLVLAFCVLVLPYGILDDKTGLYIYIAWGLYATVIPFYIALYQVLKLLGNVDKGVAFSASSVRALSAIKVCGLVIGGMFTAGLPYIYYAVQMDDSPGLLALSLLITGGAFFVAAAAALFQRLIQHAVDIKSENDLTV